MNLAVLARMFSRRWILATILALLGTALCARLGIWQLDRLQQRRLFNSRVLEQQALPQLDLNTALADDDLPQDLPGMEYRAVRVTGTYDFSQQVALRNQVYENASGVHLLTPLHISGSQAVVLVDRGWIPAEDFAPEKWSQYDEPGVVTVQGLIRRELSKPDFGSTADPTPAPGEHLTAWNMANVAGIAQQMPYPLLPVYIQQAPESSWTTLPQRSTPDLDLTEGPHQSYAIQWFAFASLLLFGYPVYVSREK